jgi:predicted acyl esterase
MFGKTWQTSEPKYKVISEKGIMIPISDGIKLEAYIFRPESSEKFPAIVGASPYGKVGQSEPIRPAGFEVATEQSTTRNRNPGFRTIRMISKSR